MICEIINYEISKKVFYVTLHITLDFPSESSFYTEWLPI
jgi:hypothetical protein